MKNSSRDFDKTAIDRFQYDVVILFSYLDAPTVKDIARRLTSDGITCIPVSWPHKFKEPNAIIQDQIFEKARTAVLCLSNSLLNLDWSDLKANTLRYRDPLDKGRKFIPLMLEQFDVESHFKNIETIDWTTEARDRSYATLLEACKPPAKPFSAKADSTPRAVSTKKTRLTGHSGLVHTPSPKTAIQPAVERQMAQSSFGTY